MTKRTLSYHIWPRELAVEEVLLWARAFSEKRGFTHANHSFFQLSISEFEDYNCSSVEEICEVLRANRNFIHLSADQDFVQPDNKERRLKFEVTVGSGTVNLAVGANELDVISAAHEEGKVKFSLRNPNRPPVDRERAKWLQATIFLGRHFDEETASVSRKLSNFLSLIGFQVVEGEEYNSQPIPEKVKQRICAQDIYVGLVTGKREHDWITAEAAYALGRGKHIILVVQEGSRFNPTLTGIDREQIRFTADNVEASFVKMLEEFRSVGICGLL
jgi:hypothetical protein